jgi:glutamate racemase
LNFFNKHSPIGIFDSGIGGLTVVKQISSYLPNENIIYFGDTARVPYGSKSNETVIEYSLQDADFLINKNVKLIVVACNTASSVALEALQNRYDIPVIGMIEPGTQYALQQTKNNKIGVIGTRATINNQAYSRALKNLDNSLSIYEKACPLFVPLAEEGWTNHKATTLIAEDYLAELKEYDIDTLILGCTHYPILKDIIQKAVGEKVYLVDSGKAAAYLVEKYLGGRNLKNDSFSLGRSEIYVSDVPNKFQEVAERFLGKPLEHIEKIDLEEIIHK